MISRARGNPDVYVRMRVTKVFVVGLWFNVPVNSYGHVETVEIKGHTERNVVNPLKSIPNSSKYSLVWTKFGDTLDSEYRAFMNHSNNFLSKHMFLVLRRNVSARRIFLSSQNINFDMIC